MVVAKSDGCATAGVPRSARFSARRRGFATTGSHYTLIRTSCGRLPVGGIPQVLQRTHVDTHSGEVAVPLSVGAPTPTGVDVLSRQPREVRTALAALRPPRNLTNEL